MGEENKKLPDLLIFMSDQHTSYVTGYFGHNVDTPNLDRLAAEGTRFDNTYTPCPLCVPARMAMMSALYPKRTGVYTNDDTIADIQPTFLHPLLMQGYETVLCGRMHFVGADQRHGFTKRIAPDTTPVSWTRPVSKLQEQRGILVQTFADFGAIKVVGGGESPVMGYDRVVVDAALKYLAEDHEKPQCIVVGTYGPHFPYITTPELFRKYMERVETSHIFDEAPEYMNEVLLHRQRPATPEVAKGCLAAYCGLVETMDGQIGEVRKAFEEFTKRRGTEGVFCYLSDHGDQLGDRKMFGKDTFFEKSAKVPMLFAGTAGLAAGEEAAAQIPAGKVVNSATSILDLGPTLWDLAGVPAEKKLPECDGESLTPFFTDAAYQNDDRVVFSEGLDGFPRFGLPYHYGKMAVQGTYKYITYDGYEAQDMLFDTVSDPDELKNLVTDCPEKAAELRDLLYAFSDPEKILEKQKIHEKRADFMRAYEAATIADDTERWQDNPPTARGQLKVGVTETAEEIIH